MAEFSKLRVGEERSEDRFRIAQHAIAAEGLVQNHRGPHRTLPPKCVRLGGYRLPKTSSQVEEAAAGGGKPGHIHHPDHQFTIKSRAQQAASKGTRSPLCLTPDVRRIGGA